MVGYAPTIDAAVWDQIRPFVEAVIADSRGQTAYDDRELYVVVTALAAWIVTRAGYDLRRDVAFDPYVIDQFVMEGLAQYTKAGRGTMRSRLRRVSEVLLPGGRIPALERPLGKSDPCKPYSSREVSTLEGWARALPYSPSHSARRLLALGLGAGLSGAEIGAVHVDHLLVDGDGVCVRVASGRPRVVPVLHSWEGALLTARREVPAGGWVFRTGRETRHRNAVTNFVEKHTPPVALQARRMRATWIIAHLNAGTPVRALLRIAGLSSAEALDSFLPHVSEQQSVESLRTPAL